MKKTLYILRHAKAESGPDDHERPLAERGKKEAHAMGEYLCDHDIRPEKIICSSSLRTRQTWEQIEPWYKQLLLIDYSDALYLASANDMLKLLGKIPDSLQSVMLIGHNPGLHELCLKLIGGGEDKLRRELNAKFPPCAFAEILFDLERWTELAKTRGALKRFITPDSL